MDGKASARAGARKARCSTARPEWGVGAAGASLRVVRLRTRTSRRAARRRTARRSSPAPAGRRHTPSGVVAISSSWTRASETRPLARRRRGAGSAGRAPPRRLPASRRRTRRARHAVRPARRSRRAPPVDARRPRPRRRSPDRRRPLRGRDLLPGRRAGLDALLVAGGHDGASAWARRRGLERGTRGSSAAAAGGARERSAARAGTATEPRRRWPRARARPAPGRQPRGRRGSGRARPRGGRDVASASSPTTAAPATAPAAAPATKPCLRARLSTSSKETAPVMRYSADSSSAASGSRSASGPWSVGSLSAAGRTDRARRTAARLLRDRARRATPIARPPARRDPDRIPGSAATAADPSGSQRRPLGRGQETRGTARPRLGALPRP